VTGAAGLLTSVDSAGKHVGMSRLFLHPDVPCHPSPDRKSPSQACANFDVQSNFEKYGWPHKIYACPILYLKQPFCTIFRADSVSDGPEAYVQAKNSPTIRFQNLVGDFLSLGALRNWCQYNRTYGTLPYPIQLQPELVTGAAGGLTGAEPYWPMYPTDTAAGVALLQLRIPRLRGM